MSKKFITIIISAVVIIIAIIAGIYYFLSGNKTSGYVIIEAKTGDITEQVSLTGQVKASQGVDMGFEVPGKIVANYVKVGDKIRTGQVLAVLDSSALLAQLNAAKAGLKTAQANYDKLINGATPSQIQTAQDGVDAADQKLKGTYNTSLSSLSDAYSKIYNAYNVIVNLHNAYFSSADPAGIIFQDSMDDINSNLTSVKIYLDAANANPTQDNIDTAISKMTASLAKVYTDVDNIRLQCDSGIYYYKVSAADKASLDAQKTYINGALSGISAIQQGIPSLKIALRSAQNQLALIKTLARTEDISLAKAGMDSATAAVQAVQSQIAKTEIVALFDGQVDKNNVTVGNIASAGAPMITISNNNLEIDTFIPEVDLTKAKVGNKALITLDALSGTPQSSSIFSVDTAPSVINGVAVYGAKLKFDKQNDVIKPGMTANINIISDTHTNVIIVPKSAVIKNSQGSFVVTENNGKKETKQVTVGLDDGKNVEILTGLTAGDKVLTY